MMTLKRTTGLAAAAIAAAVMIASPAAARPWHRHHHWGAGAGIGFATGAIIGSALASRPYYGYGPYAYDNGPYVVDDGYASAGGDVQYCMQRFKSYNPSTGTYRGYDGADHPCP